MNQTIIPNDRTSPMSVYARVGLKSKPPRRINWSLIIPPAFLKSPDIDITLEAVAKSVAGISGMPLEELTRPSSLRDRHVVKYRQIAIYLIKDLTGDKYTLKEIGDYFGGRDHTTMIYSIQTVKNLRDVDEAYRKEVEKIAQFIKNTHNIR